MKRIAKAIGGAILGYVVVALTIGFVMENRWGLLLSYAVGMIVGGVMGWGTKQEPSEA